MKVCVRGSFFCYKIPWLFYLPFIVGIGDLGNSWKFINMPPRVRGRGKVPMRGGPSTAGPSHRRTPSASFSTSDSHDLWAQPFEPARHSVSLSSSPSFHPSFGPLVPDEPQHSHHSQQSHDSHESYQSHHSLHSHSFHHSDSLYSPGQFNSNDYVNNLLGYNPLGPEDHFSQEMEMDDDPDPEMQTPGHPISIPSESPFQGSPYHGPDSFQEKMATYNWFFTPSYHSSPAQPPLVEPQLQAVSPPPLPVEEPPQQPPQPPSEPPRQRRNARISVWGGPRFSSPQGSSSYPLFRRTPRRVGPRTRHLRLILRQFHLHHLSRLWVLITLSRPSQVLLSIIFLKTRRDIHRIMELKTRTLQLHSIITFTLLLTLRLIQLDTRFRVISTRRTSNLLLSSYNSSNRLRKSWRG
ncbi:hypothetical protein HanRHA438_Chr00c48g0858421 [Helianthus annuus]|uniref:uncharacterized protein LOC110885148 isoform X1 n=1 Tax=Helianthus annuus TaxID=4232 RepID=UPI001652EEF4|nr:uncharacterized protein LOC110885148 isoform X1 [Helianthus annuus]XP_035839824.1 uncharacterized protein LOC110885148 isoform X1 [Helianthus annuus]XP_035839825.1 uncharacterized protein LOC110885148 isoform X1 [Helianthus annuus]KAJ0953759.1 hypothetical protein HanRHA438_Chr00c48g0858421 [Helianthus annuus]